MHYTSNSCSKFYFIFFVLFSILNGFFLFIYGLWVLLDPMKSYTLNLVDFSENIPYLKFATFTLLLTTLFTFFTGCVGLVGGFKSEKCLISSFFFFTLVIFCFKWICVSLAFAYKKQFLDDKMIIYLTNISQNRYYRDKWVLPLMDTIQFYQQCCGGSGPKDYFNSFWYLNNNERGTRSFVPRSCCKQSQDSRAWFIFPIDPMCTTYHYYTKAFNDSVNVQGCGKLTNQEMSNQVHSFVFISIISSIFDVYNFF